MSITTRLQDTANRRKKQIEKQNKRIAELVEIRAKLLDALQGVYALHYGKLPETKGEAIALVKAQCAIDKAQMYIAQDESKLKRKGKP